MAQTSEVLLREHGGERSGISRYDLHYLMLRERNPECLPCPACRIGRVLGGTAKMQLNTEEFVSPRQSARDGTKLCSHHGDERDDVPFTRDPRTTQERLTHSIQYLFPIPLCFSSPPSFPASHSLFSGCSRLGFRFS